MGECVLRLAAHYNCHLTVGGRFKREVMLSAFLDRTKKQLRVEKDTELPGVTLSLLHDRHTQWSNDLPNVRLR